MSLQSYMYMYVTKVSVAGYRATTLPTLSISQLLWLCSSVGLPTLFVAPWLLGTCKRTLRGGEHQILILMILQGGW